MADFSKVLESECRKQALPQGVTLPSSRTIVLQSVLNEIKEHGRSSLHAEVCGVLVGNLCWDGGPYLRIDARIEGQYATHQSGSVTFTAETWTYIHEQLAAKYPDRKIVGWYHTHPGFGIFLSNMDVFIHQNFFGIRWSPAYVFDPQSETEGFFFWKDSDLLPESVAIVTDVDAVIEKPKMDPSQKFVVLTEDEERLRSNVRFFRMMGWFFTVLLVVGTIFAGIHFLRELKALRGGDDQWRLKAKEWEAYIQSADQKILQLINENKALVLASNGLASALAKTEDRLTALSTELETEKRSCSELRAKNAQLQDDTEAKQRTMAEERVRHSEEILLMRTKLTQFESDAERLRFELDSSRAKIDALEKESSRNTGSPKAVSLAPETSKDDEGPSAKRSFWGWLF